MGDVGNLLIVGPLGSGKSTDVLFALAQFVARYARAQGYILEVGASGKALTYAMGGQYFDLGSQEMAFQPLRDIDDEQQRRWGCEWVEQRFIESGHTSLLRLRRKDNLAIWFCTQTGADILGTKIAKLILDSCMTRILLPNPAALDAVNDEVYTALRMNRRQRRLIARAQPKCQFYFDSPQGSRLCDLSLDGITLAVCGANSDEDRKLVDRLYVEVGPTRFLETFLQAKGLEPVAKSLAQEVLHALDARTVAD